jgi:hypothetical protein
MKTVKKLLLVLLVTISGFGLNAKLDVTDFCTTALVSDNPLTVSLVKQDSEIALRISFSGNEGTTGTVKIYNSQNQFVNSFPVELKNLPNYYSVNLNEFADGVYQIHLVTSVGVHTTQITIQ